MNRIHCRTKHCTESVKLSPQANSQKKHAENNTEPDTTEPSTEDASGTVPAEIPEEILEETVTSEGIVVPVVQDVAAPKGAETSPTTQKRTCVKARATYRNEEGAHNGGRKAGGGRGQNALSTF